MTKLPVSLRLKLPFLVAGFVSFLFSVWLYFVKDETTAGIFVGLWVPSIHSLDRRHPAGRRRSPRSSLLTMARAPAAEKETTRSRRRGTAA